MFGVNPMANLDIEMNFCGKQESLSSCFRDSDSFQVSFRNVSYINHCLTDLWKLRDLACHEICNCVTGKVLFFKNRWSENQSRKNRCQLDVVLLCIFPSRFFCECFAFGVRILKSFVWGVCPHRCIKCCLVRSPILWNENRCDWAGNDNSFATILLCTLHDCKTTSNCRFNNVLFFQVPTLTWYRRCRMNNVSTTRTCSNDGLFLSDVSFNELNLAP